MDLKSLFENVLRKFHNSPNLEVLECKRSGAVTSGENYTSDLFRVEVTYKNGSNDQSAISTIVKVEPHGCYRETFAKNLDLFPKELRMYQNVLPKIHAICGVEWEEYFGPTCLGTSKEPATTIVLEDLQPHGYGMTCRKEGMDYEQCAMVMKKIAQFHACSVVLASQDVSEVVIFEEGLYKNDPETLRWLDKGFKSMVQLCMQRDDLRRYGEKLQKLDFETYLKRGLDSSRRNVEGFSVLNHGDTWTNNMLFLYDSNGKLKNLKFVDFQMVKYTSPALDLHYFFTTSPSISVRAEKIDDLLDVYYANLIEMLERLEYPLTSVPSKDEFKKDFHSRAFYCMLAAPTTLSLVKAEHHPDASFDGFISEEDGPGSFRHHVFNCEAYISSLGQVLSYCDSLGILD